MGKSKLQSNIKARILHWLKKNYLLLQEVAPGRLPKIQYLAPHPWKQGQH